MPQIRRWLPIATLLLASATGNIAAGQAQTAPVAEVLGRTIERSEIDPPPSGPQGGRAMNAETADQFRKDRLRTLIWSAIFLDYAEKRGIAPQPSEIQSNVTHSRRLREESRVEQVRQRAALQEELKSPNLTEARRKQAQEHLDILERTRDLEQRGAASDANPEFARMREEAEQRVAAHWVRQWKVNQALFREFGGRLAFQQAGWEPVDAYRKLIEDYEARGAFKVHDPALRPAIYSYFDHKFVYISDPAQAAFYYEKPWWERSKQEFEAAGFR